MNRISRGEISMYAGMSNLETCSPDIEKLVCSSLGKPNQEIRYRRFIYRLALYIKPKLYIELGAYEGATCEIVRAACEFCTIIAVDDCSANSNWITKDIKDTRLLRIHADTVLAAKRIAKYREGTCDMIFFDSCHRSATVKAEIKAYTRFLSPHAMLLFDDINIDNIYKIVKSFSNHVVLEGLGGAGGRDFGVVIL